MKHFTSLLRMLLLTSLGLFGTHRLHAAAPHVNPSSPDFPAVTLPHPARSEQAIQALGQHLPEVARAYGLSADELKRRLRTDSMLGVDRQGRLFYADEFLPQGAGTTSGGAAVAADIPLDQTFLLHSKPGASRVLYLDFDGHTLTNCSWNSYTGVSTIVCPPWDIDGNAASFGDTEKTAIGQIWQRVAEDYAPFDVDVTTQYPGEAAITRSSSSDTVYGTRVLISPISGYFGNYGGIAYVGVYADVGDFYKPALVFPEKLANSEKYIAEAASHEAGHNLGLSHDGVINGAAYYAGQGSGEVGWAPIMGVGYYQNLTQWSKGEYTSANNTEDDLAVITAHGLSYRNDDHGDTDATASYFPAGTTLSGSGLIERNTDVDVLAFTTGAGAISLSVTPAPRGPDLDVLARLYDANGTLIATGNPGTQLAASINVSVAAGTYFLRIEGTGYGSPSSTGYSKYASLGAYTVTGTVVNPSGTVPPVANASATPTSGTAPLAVGFDGTGSFDQDGTINSYAWNFGDGQNGTGATTSHTYTTAGNYTATLTVTDNSNLTGSDTVGISVSAPNVNPNAVMSATPSSGYAPLAVSFNSAGSSDPDGSIASYAWNFGDGGTATGATASHTYTAAGNYTATLTVTDNRGGTGTATAPITVQSNPNAIVRVASIQLVAVSVPGGKQGRATVRITDPNNSNVSGATVTGTFSGLVSSTASGTTLTDGTVILSSAKFKKSGTLTFRVTNVTKNGYTYNAAQNAVTQVSISAAPTH